LTRVRFARAVLAYEARSALRHEREVEVVQYLAVKYLRKRMRHCGIRSRFGLAGVLGSHGSRSDGGLGLEEVEQVVDEERLFGDA